MTADITLHPLTDAHLPGAHALSKQAGWPHRLEDWHFALTLSRGVVSMEGDRVTGTALCSDFGDRAAINLIIVDEALRGHGLGRRLMEAAMALAGDTPLYLTATSDGQPLYEKLGFRGTPVREYRAFKGGLPDLYTEAKE